MSHLLTQDILAPVSISAFIWTPSRIISVSFVGPIIMLKDLGYDILTSVSPLPPRVPSLLLFIGVDWSAPFGEWTHPLSSPPLASFPCCLQKLPSPGWDIASDNAPNRYICNTVRVGDLRKVCSWGTRALGLIPQVSARLGFGGERGTLKILS